MGVTNAHHNPVNLTRTLSTKRMLRQTLTYICRRIVSNEIGVMASDLFDLVMQKLINLQLAFIPIKQTVATIPTLQMLIYQFHNANILGGLFINSAILYFFLTYQCKKNGKFICLASHKIVHQIRFPKGEKIISPLPKINTNITSKKYSHDICRQTKCLDLMF